MDKSHEDELLKSLFRKLKLEEAPADLTIKVMDQIMVNPAAEPYLRLYKVFLWTGIGLLSILSMHLTGVFNSLERLFIPYISATYNLFDEYTGALSGLFPSNTILFPSSVLPVLLPGVLLILMIDILFDMDVRRLKSYDN
jgi:hypothetical protein